MRSDDSDTMQNQPETGGDDSPSQEIVHPSPNSHDSIMDDSDTEDVQQYGKGGHHPVRLGDMLNERFKVIHKLGSGGFGIVWFCRDVAEEKWRAVKIATAQHSSASREVEVFGRLRERASAEQLEANHIAAPLEMFWIEGPNGRHLCLVMPVLGGPAHYWRWLLDTSKEQSAARIRRVCAQMARAVGFLHRHGVCHGDIKPGNMMMRLDGLDEMDEGQVVALLGKPRRRRVVLRTGESVRPGMTTSPGVPRHLVVPVRMDWCRRLLSDSVAVVDFGGSYFAGAAPEDNDYTVAYAAPEVLLWGSGDCGPHSDVWSLACTIFQIRHGPALFPSLDEPEVPYDVLDLEIMLGPLPEPFRTARRRAIAALLAKEYPDHNFEGIELRDDKMTDLDPTMCTRAELLAEINRIIGSEYSTVMEAVLDRRRKNRPRVTDVSSGSTDDGKRVPEVYCLTWEEVVQLSALLQKMLRYNPSERITMEEVLRDPWISS
ncbi:putative CMGC protein kinase [Rosellinia necatrix]|uniref:non-specific serine/threonine protein kinase n=1 Tax=Rosellinia necatrix TaxID=77044 RepID=A0A1W2TIT8_ROSNE|nr:putative CMGC protein kinase [Rosellinia necatrix]